MSESEEDPSISHYDDDIEKEDDEIEQFEPAKKKKKLSTEVEQLLTTAYNYYLDKNYEQCITTEINAILLSAGEIIDPYYTLFQCYGMPLTRGPKQKRRSSPRYYDYQQL